MKSLIGNTELFYTSNRLGDSVPSLYSARVDWHNIVSPLDYSIELSADDIQLPGKINPGAFTTLLYGNMKSLEKTVSEERTTCRGNGAIAIHANFIGPAPRKPIPEV